MAVTLNEQIAKAKERVGKLEQRKRVQARLERNAQRKKEARRNYVLGELITKYFHDEVVRFDVGTKAENATIFEPFEALLMVLADEPELMVQLKERAAQVLQSPNLANTIPS